MEGGKIKQAALIHGYAKRAAHSRFHALIIKRAIFLNLPHSIIPFFPSFSLLHSEQPDLSSSPDECLSFPAVCLQDMKYAEMPFFPLRRLPKEHPHPHPPHPPGSMLEVLHNRSPVLISLGGFLSFMTARLVFRQDAGLKGKC